MAKYCSNCGTQIQKNANFCASCGQTAVQPVDSLVQQPNPQYVPAPAKEKQKNKTPIIIAGATVLVVALAVVLIFTKGFGLFREVGDASALSDGSGGKVRASINAPKNASEEEKLAYEYVQGATELLETGIEFEEMGFSRAANSLYGAAGASISAMRYAVDCLLGTSPEAGRPTDWYEIAMLSWASPAPYFFEGVVYEAQGRSGEAEECYRKAALNPNFPEDGAMLMCIKDLDIDALKSLRSALMELENKIYELWTPEAIGIPRHENNFNPAYLREQALECFKEDENDYSGALMFYSAALAVNPFDGDNYAGPVLLYIYLEDGDEAIHFLNAGLLVDPDNARLNTLLKAFEGV